MIQRSGLFTSFERDLLKKRPADHFENLRIFEALYDEARLFGVLPLRDPLEGIEVDVRLAKALNVRTSS
jgi:hypothetical protein